jgi:predicted Zn-dependent peptidase
MVHVEHMAPEPPPPGVSFKVAGTDRLDVVMRFPGVPEGHPHDRALELLMLALGGFSSGRLFQSLRERDGLCYAIQASVEGHRGVGSAIITTELSPEKFGLAMQAIWKEVWAVRKRGLSVEELKAVKAYSQANVLLQKDQPLQVAEEAARAVLLSRYETPAEEIRRIDAVTLEDIRVVAKLYLDLTKVHVAVVGPASARRSVEKPIAAPWLW